MGKRLRLLSPPQFLTAVHPHDNDEVLLTVAASVPLCEHHPAVMTVSTANSRRQTTHVVFASCLYATN